MPLEAESVSDSLNRVQKNVEEYFYGIRKEMFKYDEILSTQREALILKSGLCIDFDIVNISGH